jgi:hypothetical protein
MNEIELAAAHAAVGLRPSAIHCRDELPPEGVS